MHRHHSLDGLRAAACLLVLLHHLGVSTVSAILYENGQQFAGKFLGSFTASGVELFFVLSAVVLVGPYVRGDKKFNLRTYSRRRVERLMPPYFAAWCLAGLAIYFATYYPTWWTKSASLPTFSVTTWIEQIGIVYIGVDRYNFAWWSLTTEVAFYILLPAIIPFFSRWQRIPPILTCIFLGTTFLAAISATVWVHISTPVLGDLALYASCFSAGLVLACHVPEKSTAHSMWIAGLIWVVAASNLAHLNVHVGWGLVYFGLVALAMQPSSFVKEKFSSFLWVWLGERSYSLFLVHYSMIVLVCHVASFVLEEKSFVYFILTRSASIACSFLAAILIFHFIERRTARNLMTSNYFFPWSPRKLANHG